MQKKNNDILFTSSTCPQTHALTAERGLARIISPPPPPPPPPHSGEMRLNRNVLHAKMCLISVVKMLLWKWHFEKPTTNGAFYLMKYENAAAPRRTVVTLSKTADVSISPNDLQRNVGATMVKRSPDLKSV